MSDHALVLGRGCVGTAPRRSSIRVFSDIDSIRPLREGLERGGCPPHLARWSAQLGTEQLRGTGLRAQGRIPGMWADRTP